MRRQNHSEIEKRRRDKMNTYITELSGMVPMCSAMSRKLDKLTVLRMAVQHMKTLRGSRIHSYTEGHYKPSFVSDEELKHLILQSAEGFLFVVGCDRGRLLYVSESVSQVLNYSQADLLGQSWFDILHPKDVAKVKEQLSSSDLAPRERLIDAKTMLPVKGNVPQKTNRLCPGARRSFFCRMKCKMSPVVKEEAEASSISHRRKKSSSNERKYIVIHCTGYLKSWAKVGLEEAESETEDPCNLSCLVAIGRILPPITVPPPSIKYRPVSFISRHAIDGKFVFVDQRATLIVGFLPQELLGTSMYEYYHHEDIPAIAESHKAALTTKDTVSMQVYRFRSRDSTYIHLQSTWKAFRNPWTKDIEYIVAKNILARSDMLCTESTTVKSETFQSGDFEFLNGGNNNGNGVGSEIQRLISTQVPVRKIGEQIADEIIENQRRCDSSSSNSPVSALDSVLGPSSAEVQQPMLSPSSNLVNLNSSSQQASQQAQASPQPLMSSHLTPSDQQHSVSCSPSNHQSPSGEATVLHLSNAHQPAESPQPMQLEPPSDPVVGAQPGTPNPVDSENNGNRPIRVNGNNNLLIRSPAETLDESDDQMLYMIGESVLTESPQPNGETGDGNDEAAMAVIMSLLEADAGLGGPVDFSGLPWPLP
ncbi:Protein cycle [Orchesella cincta]|uniref:Protein cycle n=1 Tax=Orchesella cincta TaxID=48709 RepID=A0A1D2N7B0_ORCCI|nr:Protein cycle [Orchesella cincta]